MRRFLFGVFFLVTSAFAQDPSRMDEMVNSYFSKKQFMGSVLVARGDQVLFNKGYGFADLEKRIPDTTETKFEIGSITKQFTAAAILLLEEEGLLRIRNPINNYLQDAPVSWKGIEIYHLLTHTSGIPEMSSFPELQKSAAIPHTPEQLVAMMRDKPLDFPPGTRMRYSNSGYVVLGYLIEKISGETYQEFIQKHIFDPLGMKDSGCRFTSDGIPRMASGYVTNPKGPARAEFVHMSNAYSAGGIYSTTGDLLRWERGLFSGKVISAASLAKLITPNLNGYAFGVGVHTVNGRKTIEHSGGTFGFNSQLEYFPDTKVTVCVLANQSGRVLDEIAGVLTSQAYKERVVLPSELKAIMLTAGLLAGIAVTVIFVNRPQNQTRQKQGIPMSITSEPAIEIRDLSFSYSSLEVLHGISFSVRRGEMIGLLGPNGAGKSTTIKILAGIHPTVRGKVHIAGYALPEQHLEAKRIIGYLPESPLMYECLSGMEFLELMGRLQGLDERILHTRISALLEAFDLNNVRVPRISGYSKGMRQKILLSAALLHDPEILLLDEPLSGLDVDACILVKDMLMTLCAQGKTILYSSHVLDVVEKVCHRVIVIDHGSILADAPLEELKSRTSEESLEVIFRKLTHSEDTGPKIARIMEALQA
jgi:ABC-type multidrug transport system ATPase subunit/CubicO group peptidase (beta-lactamase class C family)